MEKSERPFQGATRRAWCELVRAGVQRVLIEMLDPVDQIFFS